MESKRLRQRLARLFRASVLLRSPCNFSASTSSSSVFSSTAAGSTSSRGSISATIAVEPVFLPRNVDATVPPFLNDVDRSRTSPKKEERQRARRGGARSSCTPMATSPKKKDYFYYNQATTTKKSKKLLSNGYGFSSSSSDEGSGPFSSDGEETETFFSSRSFSSDSSEFYSNNSKKKKKDVTKENDQKKKLSRRPPTHTRIRSNESSQTVELEGSGRARSGVPVTKRSRDPYADFRDSMVEMIVERQIFGTEGLEELLCSYLSLNSDHHHPVILRAFADISEVLFGQ
ncbi:uncharacterized protein M6B38_287180 [Iris pallida]|uniref:Transcription repressor n=1 Tax=Iris pallida TaxID=29817 RepID=A0AAX6HZ38_IRIPA|nr:uncharacterized protein M6B38_287180 [Iris pallida]